MDFVKNVSKDKRNMQIVITSIVSLYNKHSNTSENTKPRSEYHTVKAENSQALIKMTEHCVKYSTLSR